LAPFASSGDEHGRGFFRELPVMFVLALVLALLLRALIAQAFFLPSISMGCATCPVHTLEIDDKVVVSKISYRLHAPRRGDVIVFDAPPSAQSGLEAERGPVVKVVRGVGQAIGVIPPSTEEFIKRIIALPGETVEGRDGRIYVGQRALNEPYLPDGPATTDFPAQTLGPDQYWVMGDNRNASRDSRFFGPIERDTVVGRTILRVWPPRRAAFL
ncbi:MAG: signal peptidase I, partial [Acidimicrobiales bacterium]